MALFKCKMCGGDLNVVEGALVAECTYCGTQQTLPRVGDESITNLFNRANRLRLHSEFDKAEELYEKILNLDDTEAEAHWGVVLCKYGIEYVEDPTTYERIPTCHRASFEAILEDNDYLSAIANADTLRKAIYEKEAKQIEKLQRDVLKIVEKEEPFDVFICYKESDDRGERTKDSVIAQDIYDALTAKGLRVFFARITLEDKLGSAYEPYIFAALNSSKVMVVVGTKPDYCNAVWVRNEWSRFLKLMKQNHEKILIPVYQDMDPYDLPEAFSHLQAQNMAKIGAMQDLVRGIKKIIAPQTAEAAVSYFERANDNQRMLDQAFAFLEDGNYKVADSNCTQVLMNDPENGMAYVGKLMAELRISSFTYAKFARKKYKQNPNYIKALEYGDEFVKEKFAGFEQKKKRSRKIMAIASAVAVMGVSVVAVFANFFFLELPYRNAVEQFWINQWAPHDSDSYSLLADDFEKLKGYKDSENYWVNASLCAGSQEKFDVKELILYGRTHQGITGRQFPLLEEVIIQDTNSIKVNFFKDVTTLKKVSMTDDIIQIGDSAFDGCTSLETIELSASLEVIGSYAFNKCSKLTEITIPATVTKIDSFAFANCTALEKISISAKEIEPSAFVNCTALKEVVLCEGLEEIGNAAFLSCESLQKIVLPDSLTSVGEGVFEKCSALSEVKIGSGMTIISRKMFFECAALKEITIASNIQTISSLAFEDCDALTDIYIPNSVTYIGTGAFGLCTNLKNIYCEAEEQPTGWSAYWKRDCSASVIWGS